MNPNQSHSQNAMTFYLTQQASRFESDCRWHQQQLERAETMRQVRDCAHVILRSELRGMPGVREAETRLRWAAERRMEDLLDEQLDKLRKCETMEDFKQLHGRLQMDEWPFMRGDFARVFVKAERESHMVRHGIETKIAGSAAGASTTTQPEPTQSDLDGEQPAARKPPGSRPR